MGSVGSGAASGLGNVVACGIQTVQASPGTEKGESPPFAYLPRPPACACPPAVWRPHQGIRILVVT